MRRSVYTVPSFQHLAPDVFVPISRSQQPRNAQARTVTSRLFGMCLKVTLHRFNAGGW